MTASAFSAPDELCSLISLNFQHAFDFHPGKIGIHHQFYGYHSNAFYLYAPRSIKCFQKDEGTILQSLNALFVHNGTLVLVRF